MHHKYSGVVGLKLRLEFCQRLPDKVKMPLAVMRVVEQNVFKDVNA